MSEQPGAPTMTLEEASYTLLQRVTSSEAKRLEAARAVDWYDALIKKLPKDAEGVPFVPDQPMSAGEASTRRWFGGEGEFDAFVEEILRRVQAAAKGEKR